MFRTLQKHKFKFLSVLLLVALFAVIRAYEDNLFYDPFLNYFKSDFNKLPLPKYDLLNLNVSIVFRYGLNMGISIAILYVLFKDIEMIKFVSILYVFFFFLLILSFFGIIYFYESHNNGVLFYVRRFLIQPIFILLFVPAFYYQKHSK